MSAAYNIGSMVDVVDALLKRIGQRPNGSTPPFIAPGVSATPMGANAPVPAGTAPTPPRPPSIGAVASTTMSPANPQNVGAIPSSPDFLKQQQGIDAAKAGVTMPNKADYQPSTLRKIGAIAAGVGTGLLTRNPGVGWSIGSRIENAPYEKAVEGYNTQMAPIMQRQGELTAEEGAFKDQQAADIAAANANEKGQRVPLTDENGKPLLDASGAVVMGTPETQAKLQGGYAANVSKQPVQTRAFDALVQGGMSPSDAYTKVMADKASGTPVHDAYHEWLANNPRGSYLDFLKQTAGVKGAGKPSGLQFYALSRLIDMSVREDPQLQPLIPQMLSQLGMDVKGVDLTAVPGQPVGPNGQPIGTVMPGAPTATTRTQGQTAERVIQELPDIKQEIKDNAKYLGPAHGRTNVAFLLGKVGSTGNPDTDEALSKLRTDITFLSGAAARFHLNSVRAMEQFEADANAGKDSAPALNGFINSISDWAATAAKQGEGQGVGNTPPPGKVITLDQFLRGGTQ